MHAHIHDTGGTLYTAEERAAKGLPKSEMSTSELKSEGGEHGRFIALVSNFDTSYKYTIHTHLLVPPICAIIWACALDEGFI